MAAGLSATPAAGRREVRWTGLVAALAAAAWLLSLSPGPAGGGGARSATPSLGSVWPDATRGSVSGSLPDGTAYTPNFFLDAGTSIGQALTPDEASVRLLVVRAPDSVRELRRLPATAAPQFFGFTAAGGRVAWAESVADATGTRTTSMWVTRAGGVDAAHRIMPDAGDVRQTDSAHELAIVDGRLHWTVVAPGDTPTTELRSVALDGGGARSEPVPGLWSPVGWPWLLDASGAVVGGRVRLMDRVQRATKDVATGQTDFPECGATWCRVLVLDDAGDGRVDLVRVDGTQRRRIAGSDMGFPVTDVAVLDRFEVLTSFASGARVGQGRPLLLYDLARAGVVTVAPDAVTVFSRGGFLWWSSGFEDRVSWNAVDLRTLS